MQRIVCQKHQIYLVNFEQISSLPIFQINTRKIESQKNVSTGLTNVFLRGFSHKSDNFFFLIDCLFSKMYDPLGT